MFLRSRARRLCASSIVLVGLCSSMGYCQTSGSPVASQPSGISWAQRAMAALTGGSKVHSITESGTVTRTVAGEREDGSISLHAEGVMRSVATISMSSGDLTESRSWTGGTWGGQWSGADGKQHQMLPANCWTDAAWFFPALSSLSRYFDPTLVFLDEGQQQFNGQSVEHIQIYRYIANAPAKTQREIQSLSTTDYYLDSQTALPVAITFNIHSESGATVDISVSVLFTQYGTFDGIKAPVEFVRALNGVPLWRISIASVIPNS
jgi:hypothetical protein